MHLTPRAAARSAILRAGFIYTVGNALSSGVPFLLLPVLTRALSPADYGMVVSFFLLVTFSNSLAGLNVHSAVAVKWFRREGGDFRSVVGTALWLAAGTTLMCGIVLLCCAPILRTRLELAPLYWFLAAVQNGGVVVVGVRAALWQSQGLAFRAASMQVATAILNLVLSLFAVFVLSLGGAGRIMGSVAASLISAAVAIRLLFTAGDARSSGSVTDLRWLLRFGLPLVPYALTSALLANADRFSVSAILGRNALGIYGAAAQLGMIVNVLNDAFIKALSPWMYSQLAKQSARSRLRVVGAAYLLVPVWAAIAVALWLGLLTVGSVILDSRYRAAIDLSLWFLLGGAVTAVGSNVNGLFFFTSKNEWLTVATVSSAIAAAVLAPVLASTLGLKGAAVSFLIIQLLLMLLAWLLSLRIQPMPWHRPLLAVQVLTQSWGRK